MNGYINVDKLIEFVNNTKDKTIDANDIARFPIADVVEVVRCKDCRWYERDIFDREAGVCFNPNKCTKTLGFEVLNEDYCSYGEVKDVRENAMGKWVVEDGEVVCSECGEPHTETNFCPFCGADMRGGKHGEIL